MGRWKKKLGERVQSSTICSEECEERNQQPTRNSGLDEFGQKRIEFKQTQTLTPDLQQNTMAAVQR